MTIKGRRWLARGAFALVLAAVVLLLAVAGWRSLAMIGLTAIGVCAVLAGGYWFLANRGVLRWLSFILVIAAPVLILVTFALHSLLWVAIVAVALHLATRRHARHDCPFLARPHGLRPTHHGRDPLRPVKRRSPPRAMMPDGPGLPVAASPLALWESVVTHAG